jgi:hypothetical protein
MIGLGRGSLDPFGEFARMGLGLGRIDGVHVPLLPV